MSLKTTCRYGFSCASMMLQPGLEPKNCPNKNTCGLLTRLSSTETVTLQMARMIDGETGIAPVEMTSTQVAQLMLQLRGHPQNTATLGVDRQISEIQSKLTSLQAELNQINQEYIAPKHCKVHSYTAKARGFSYDYNKLCSLEPIFVSSGNDRGKVKHIHLSKDKDPRNIEGRCGIERRNRILAIKTKLSQIETLLNESQELLATPDIHYIREILTTFFS